MLLRYFLILGAIACCSACAQHETEGAQNEIKDKKAEEKSEDLTVEEEKAMRRKAAEEGYGVDEEEVARIEKEKEKYKAQDMKETAYRETTFDKDEEKITPKSSGQVNEEIQLPGGSFTMGTDKSPFPSDGEGPERHVTLRPFAIDKYEVSNNEFAEFVAETKYRSEAEKFGNSFVMDYFLTKEVNSEIKEAVRQAQWWVPVPGANWKQPEGKGSHIRDRMDHPVVHVSWNDALAYCRWKDKRLPTEAEWEYACRGGKDRLTFPWGDEFPEEKDKFRANIWQGKFPGENDMEDGYAGTCGVRTYGEQNEYGVHNMIGNVWEWVADWWSVTHNSRPTKNPWGPQSGQDKTKKGGSFMCHKYYCYRYRCSARSQNSADSSASNLGFRCAKYLPREKKAEKEKDDENKKEETKKDEL